MCIYYIDNVIYYWKMLFTIDKMICLYTKNDNTTYYWQMLNTIVNNICVYTILKMLSTIGKC